MKRSFHVHNGVLVDRFVHDGIENESREPDPRPRTPQERTAMLSRVAEGRSRSLYGLGFEPSADAKEALLLGLMNGIPPSMELLPYLDDARVRPAILAAAARVDLVDDDGIVGNVLQLLGIVGGEAAQAMLRSAIQGFLEHPLQWKDDELSNGYASNLVTSCEALLQLDTDATFAADAMIRTYEHPCAWNREKAVWRSAEVVRGMYRPMTEAFERIRHALRPMLDADDTLFLRAAIGLLETDCSHAVVERCKEILRTGAPCEHTSALELLVHHSTPLPDDTLTIAIARIREAPTLRDAFFSSMVLLRFLPVELLESLARRGLADESPSLRHEAVKLLSLLPRDTAKAIADQARVDEPDPVILYLLDQLERGDP